MNGLYDKDIPGAYDPPEDIEKTDLEFCRLLSWFIKKRKRVSWALGYDDIYLKFTKKEPYDIQTIGVIGEKHYLISENGNKLLKKKVLN